MEELAVGVCVVVFLLILSFFTPAGVFKSPEASNHWWTQCKLAWLDRLISMVQQGFNGEAVTSAGQVFILSLFGRIQWETSQSNSWMDYWIGLPGPSTSECDFHRRPEKLGDCFSSQIEKCWNGGAEAQKGPKTTKKSCTMTTNRHKMTKNWWKMTRSRCKTTQRYQNYQKYM